MQSATFRCSLFFISFINFFCMKSTIMKSAALVLLSVGLLCCAVNRKPLTGNNLKDAYKDDFLIGTALNAEQIEEKDSKANALILQQFNAITPENIMKAEIIHPEWDRYNFD